MSLILPYDFVLSIRNCLIFLVNQWWLQSINKPDNGVSHFLMFRKWIWMQKSYFINFLSERVTWSLCLPIIVGFVQTSWAKKLRELHTISLSLSLYDTHSDACMHLVMTACLLIHIGYILCQFSYLLDFQHFSCEHIV